MGTKREITIIILAIAAAVAAIWVFGYDRDASGNRPPPRPAPSSRWVDPSPPPLAPPAVDTARAPLRGKGD